VPEANSFNDSKVGARVISYVEGTFFLISGKKFPPFCLFSEKYKS